MFSFYSLIRKDFICRYLLIGSDLLIGRGAFSWNFTQIQIKKNTLYGFKNKEEKWAKSFYILDMTTLD